MGLEQVRERYFTQFPAARQLDSALKTASNPSPLFFISPIDADNDLKGSGFALLRLGNDLERRFGVNGEVAAYFTPWRDFQRRSFNAITLRTAELARSLQLEHLRSERFTPSRRVALLICEDPNVQSKLREWQSDSLSELTVIPVHPGDAINANLTERLTAELRSRLGERDLYRAQNPVSGFDFFGRSDLLTRLAASVEEDENIAVLGLRRSGKTSVLRELRRQMRSRRVVMPIADFQMLEDHSVEDLISSIASVLNEELKIAKSQGLAVWIGNEVEQVTEGLSAAGLSDRIKRVASRNPDIRIVVALDEVETAASIARKNPNAIRVILGALRSAAQGRENVSLMFSGVANRMFRSSSLGSNAEVDNPMFGQVTSVYLTPFSAEDTGALLRDLGRSMLLDWSDGAVDEVQRLTGGFPYFVRDLASTVRTSLIGGRSASGNDLIRISGSDVEGKAEAWSITAAEAWGGIVKALGIHYPSAAALLDATIAEDELNEWVEGDSDALDAAEDLVALKLLRRESSGLLKFSSTLAALQALLATRSSPSVATMTFEVDSAEGAVASLVAAGESHSVEFKETCRINVRTGSKGVEIEDAIVKTVAAFMNSEGGDLLIGVADSGQVKGLDPDLALFGGSLDRLERWLRADLLAKRIDRQAVTDRVTTNFVRVRAKQVVRVSVSRSADPVWVDDKTLYRRLGNQTVSLDSGRDIQKFLLERS